MPQRFLRPGIRTSKRWNRCDWPSQSLYARLLTLVDDHGRYEADPELLRSEAFPYGDPAGECLQLTTVAGMLRTLAAKELLLLYKTGEKEYLQILRWQERARSQSKFPEPTRQQLTTVDNKCSPPSPSPSPSPSSAPSPAPSSVRPQADSDLFVNDYGEAKRLICERILNGKDPNRFWSADADKDLLKHLPMPRLEIERVAWFLGLPNDGSPELEARKPKTETGLMAYWGDEVTRANAFWQKLYGWREKKKAAG